jgi:predicted amidophosphoribosyltransferase
VSFPPGKYMTKTCGKCGHAALDDQAQFCNRCGAAVPEERKPGFPVCPGCGAVVSDELAQYCNRCGAKIPAVPIVCSSCGNPAIDNQSRFCTRCGTTFEPKPVIRNTNCPSCGAPDPQGQSIFCNRCGAPFNKSGMPAAHPQGPAPVIVSQKKPAGPMTQVIIPETDWEPWNDVPPAPAPAAIPGPAIPEQSAHHERQVAIPQKRFAHIPLVADDLKSKGEPGIHGHFPDCSGVPQKKKGGAQKKGILKFLEK